MASGMLMAAVCLGMQFWLKMEGYDTIIQQSFVFTLLCLAQLGNALSLRSMDSLHQRKGYTNWRLWYAIALIIVLQIAILYVPLVQPIFKTKGLSLYLIGLLSGALMVMVVGFEVIKYFAKRKRVP